MLPSRKLQTRLVPHVCESTLGVEPHVAERCLNHKLKGVEGVYNRHDYFEERWRALEAWGQLLLKLERQGTCPKKPAPAHQQAPLPQEA